MFKNYLISSLRFLKNNKLFTLINIFGIALAFSVSFIIILYIINEYSYDKYYPESSKIFEVISKTQKYKSYGSPYVMKSVLKSENPEVVYSVNTKNVYDFKIENRNVFIDINAVCTQGDLFKLFSIPLLQGNLNSDLLEDKNDIVLNLSTARKLFGKENPVGKQINVKINSKNQTLTIKGVFADIPENSSLQAECFINDHWRLKNITDAKEKWNNPNWHTWVKLNTSTISDNLSIQLKKYYQDHFNDPSPEDTYNLQNLRNIHLHSDDVDRINNQGSLKTIRFLILIASLLIFIAIINYIIMSAALMVKRMKEVGIRKCSGATTADLRYQLTIEAAIIVFCALILSFCLIIIALPKITNLFHTSLLFISGNISVYISACLLITLFTALITSSYGAIILSQLKIKDLVQSKMMQTKKFSIKTGLVAFQIIVFLFFVSVSLFIHHQYNYMIHKDLGYNCKNILYLKVPNGWKDYPVFLQKIRNNANVISAGGTVQTLPIQTKAETWFNSIKDKNTKVYVNLLAVDYDFLQTIGVNVVKGRLFSKEYNDSQNSFICNESAVKALGMTDPLNQDFGTAKIIGVIKDFIPYSLHSSIPPLIMCINSNYISYIAVKYKKNSVNTLTKEIQKYWNSLNMETPLECFTFDELNRKQYQKEFRLHKIISISAIFTAIIAALGLFGLAYFEMQQSIKEVGVRKVLGATIFGLMIRFYRKNMIIFIISFLITIPTTYYIINKWLENFAYKSNFDWWLFALSGFIALAIIIITVSWQSWKAASGNPVDAIKNE